jgi:adenosylcobinamide-phosphate synthase
MEIHAPLLVLAIAIIIDLAFGEMPNTLHPVVWIGSLIQKTTRICEQAAQKLQKSQKRQKRQKYLCGLALALICISCAAASGVLLNVLTSHYRIAGIVATAYFLKSTFSIRSLVSSSNLIYRELSANDLVGARRDLIALVSRDASGLDEPKIASAAIESTAENFVDSILSPILYFALFGIPGALAYKAINTLDSMVGYKNERFIEIGFVSAKLDDVVNWIPARLSVIFILLASIRFSPGPALLVCLRDHALPASPNSGYPMAMVAGALSCRLEKPGSYVLGAEYPDPTGEHIRRANWVVLVATFLLVVVVGAWYWICGAAL